VVALLARIAKQDLEAELNPLPVNRQSEASARRQVKTFATLTDGFGGATLVGAAVATYFFFSPPSSVRSEQDSGLQSLDLSVHSAGLTLEGHF
jgi:hypothetical protein